MSVPMFVDLQWFIVNKKFIVKEVTVLKQGAVLTHYIFMSPVPWKFLTRSEVLCFLIDCLSWIAIEGRDSPIQRGETLIVEAVFKDDVIVYIKRSEKRTWLWMLASEWEMYIETLDAIYEDIEFLTNLNVANIIRCGQHVKNCALQNVLKIYNW